MKQRRHVLERFSGLSVAPLPGVPVVELAGERRVLIENHMGITEYGTEKICVQVKYGYICICGMSMVLTRISKEQLVICGHIDSVTLVRR